MKFLAGAWEWFNGNKTIIGALFLAAAPLFPDYVFVHQVLLYVGGILGGTGLLHKVVKSGK